ncbi:hypothetical protein FGO68_gene16659 [Halteria grandinella]|uniref:Uncharacterized protein n=1 Tax=Halteria grandinella TaxID=5974 RepID=A0A8J8NRA5_HALGN|nr:hypothetical protein FGO68_gene16659 [Halteria grandinella]
MKILNTCLLAVLGALTLPSLAQDQFVGSDLQAYPGVQFRVEQSFVDLIEEEFFALVPYIVNDVIAPLIPKEIRLFLGFVQVRNIYARDFTLESGRGKFTIDEKKRGVMMNWDKISNWHIHFELWYILFWPIEYSFRVDLLAKNVLIDNGLSLQADTHSGKPIVNFFNTYVDLAQSSVSLSGDFVVEIIGWFANFFKTPLNILINEFFQPFVNLVINDFIIPGFLSNGLFSVEILDSQGKHYDNLIADITLPQNPNFNSGMMDVFTDAAIYFQKQGKHIKAPTTPMRFQLDEQNLQFVLSSFTVNQVIDAIMGTEYIQLPISHELIRAVSGFELTTTLMFAVIPELFYNYGPRNMTLDIKPLTGTFVDWKASTRSTTFHARALTKWIIDEDAFDNKTAEAFESILDIDVALSLDINQTTNAVQVQLTNLTLSGFNVTVDNLGGSVKSDEAGILYRLGSVIPVDPPPRVQRAQVHREVRLPRQRLRRWHDGRAQVSHFT